MIENRDDPGLIVATYCLTLEYLKHYSMKPGIIENVVLIMNMAAFSFQNAPIYIAKHLINSIGANYKGHARAVFMVNAPTAFPMVWNSIKYFLDENQVRKVKIVSANTCPSLLELAAPNQLEE